VHLALYAAEEVLGAEIRLVREAGISFGRAIVAPAAENELPPSYLRRPDSRNLGFAHVEFPFALDDLPEGHRYTEATLAVTLDTASAVAVALGADSEPPVEVLTWGEGQQHMRWRLSVPDVRLGIRLGDHRIRTVVEFPLQTSLLSGSVDATVQVTREVLDQTRHKRARPKAPLRFAVNVAEGWFEFTPASETGQ
jgi:hypothetical protein